MNNLLAYLGQNPKRSLSFFLSGVGLFVLSVIFIGIGYFYQAFWQVIGLTLLALACVLALWGYVGIFANRWFHILNRSKLKSSKFDKTNNPE